MPIPLIAAGVAAAGAVAGGAISASASKKASKAASQAASDTNATNRYIYDSNKSLFTPSIDRGNRAGSLLEGLLGAGGDAAASKAAFDTYRGSTGYNFRLNEGLGAVNANAYARGMGDSGATLKALTQYGQNFASGEFGNYTNQLSNLMSQGAAASGALSGAGANYAALAANNNSMLATNQGNAALAGAANTNNMIGNLIQAGGYALGSSYGSPASRIPQSPVYPQMQIDWQAR